MSLEKRDEMNFVFQERQAFVRTGTHTVVRDIDPDYGYFRSVGNGVIAHLLRIWVQERRGRRCVPAAYLGSLRFCPSSAPFAYELRKVVARLREYAARRRRPREPLERELIAYLRVFTARLKLEERRRGGRLGEHA